MADMIDYFTSLYIAPWPENYLSKCYGVVEVFGCYVWDFILTDNLENMQIWISQCYYYLL